MFNLKQVINVMLQNIYPYKFNWGQVTADLYNEVTNEVTLIFNCDLTSEKNISNTFQYVVGRTCWGIINFPEGSIVKLMFDIRGQEIIVSKSKSFKNLLIDRFNKLNVVNSIVIEFLR